jgi:hypothetical protein
MRCLMCAAEMYVTQVVQAGTMPVPGFEHHTLECLECGDIERRLVFTRWCVGQALVTEAIAKCIGRWQCLGSRIGYRMA